LRLRIVTVKIEESVLEAVELLAKKEGVSRSEVIRRAVMKYLKEKRPQDLPTASQEHEIPYRVVRIEV